MVYNCYIKGNINLVTPKGIIIDTNTDKAYLTHSDYVYCEALCFGSILRITLNEESESAKNLLKLTHLKSYLICGNNYIDCDSLVDLIENDRDTAASLIEYFLYDWFNWSRGATIEENLNALKNILKEKYSGWLIECISEELNCGNGYYLSLVLVDRDRVKMDSLSLFKGKWF